MKPSIKKLRPARERIIQTWAKQLGWDGESLKEADELVAEKLGMKAISVGRVRTALDNIGQERVDMIRKELGSQAEFLNPDVLLNPKVRKAAAKTTSAKTEGEPKTANTPRFRKRRRRAARKSAKTARAAPTARKAVASGISVAYSVATLSQNGIQQRAILFPLDKKYDVTRKGSDIVVRIQD